MMMEGTPSGRNAGVVIVCRMGKKWSASALGLERFGIVFCGGAGDGCVKILS